jgi:peptide/nickel transport system substrate-binding protein
VQEKGDAYAAQNPIGTGPFKFVRWRQAELIEMAVNTGYFGTRPKIERLTVRQIPDDSTRMASLLSGETHIVVQIPPDLVKTVSAHPNSTVASVGALMGLVIEFDTVRGPLASKKIRQALNYGIDKESLVRDLLAGQGQPLQGQVMTPGAFGFNPKLKPYPYDPARAKQLLAEAGVRDGLTLTLNTPVGRYIGDREVAIAVAGQLEKIGVKVNVVAKEWGVFIKELRADQLGPMFVVGWYNYGDASFALTHFTSQSTFGVYQKNAQFDELAQQGQSQIDPESRARAYQRATELMYDEAPAAFLLQLPAIYGISKRVTGFKPRSDERWNLFDVDMRN